MSSLQESASSFKLSIIIPCFNDGFFLSEAITSIPNNTPFDIETIIVNDGSTDQNTLTILKEYDGRGVTVISQANKGLGNARNAGIKAAKGEYILPLDADNKIKPEYLNKTIELLDANVCDIVYAKPCFFGENIEDRLFTTHDFNQATLFTGNYIDACAVFRKSVWEKVGGYDEKMPFQGNEDWEFWINCAKNNFKFKFLNEELYYYRVVQNSMIGNLKAEQLESNYNYIFKKYKQEIIDQIYKGVAYQQIVEKDQKNYLRTSLKYFVKAVLKLFSIKWPLE